MSKQSKDSVFVRGAQIVDTDGIRRADILVRKGKIAAVASDLTLPEAAEYIDAQGCYVLPGLIDPQVHFREPGGEHKEDLESGPRAAIAGGVTSFLEMPNTNPPTVTPEAHADKLARAKGRARSDHGFFLGASPENADKLGEWEDGPGIPGIKVFLGSSTGSLLVRDDATLERVLRSGKKRVAVHSEDDYRLSERYAALKPGTPVSQHPEVRDVECAVRATKRLLDLVEKTQRRVHILHLSTAEEVAILRERDLGDLVTSEVTPNHLFLVAPDCYEQHGTFAQMNPPVRDRRHQEALREALADGTITCIGSDHAPHTRDEKAKPYPESPSGIPGVQTILPLCLTAVRDGWLTLQDVVRVTSSGPRDVWSIRGKGSLEVGADGDLVIVDPRVVEPLPVEWLESKVGWSPYVGMELAGWPTVTVLRGEVAYRDRAVVGEARGRALEFGG